MVQIEGARLEYSRTGSGSTGAPTLVLLHEGLGCVALWKRFPALVAAATGLEVVAYSRIGYGRSAPVLLPRPVHFMHDEAQLLPRLLEALRIERVIVLGHSDGASIALIHAAEAAEPPMGTIAIAPHVFVEEQALVAIRNAAQRYRQSDLRSRLESYHGTNVDGAFWGWNQVWLDPDFARWRIDDLLPAIRTPTMVIQGDADPYGTLDHLDTIRERSGARVEECVLTGCGHAPQFEQPDETLSAVCEFVADLLADSEGGT
ncbi:MAG: alpha/beta hydrolase [Acidobacteriota bacterium]|nr:alpha/beta hydrolase [Acidobacteriota bacterium]